MHYQIIINALLLIVIILGLMLSFQDGNREAFMAWGFALLFCLQVLGLSIQAGQLDGLLLWFSNF